MNFPRLFIKTEPRWILRQFQLQNLISTRMIFGFASEMTNKRRGGGGKERMEKEEPSDENHPTHSELNQEKTRLKT